MGAGLHGGDPVGEPFGVPCDPESWSEASKRSVLYTFPPEPYRDKAYVCWRCRTPDVFTAAEQKHAFEVRKANVSQQRVLCRACHRERLRLECEAAACRGEWVANKPTTRRDLAFLRRWLTVLETLPEYGGPRDRANIVMLRRLAAGA